MELLVLTAFGIGAYYGGVLGDSDDEEEERLARGGRRRSTVDVTHNRLQRVHEEMCAVPRPAYLVIVNEIGGGRLAPTPRVRRAWHDAVNAYRRGETLPEATQSEEESAQAQREAPRRPQLRSIAHDLRDWWRRRKEGGVSGQSRPRVFDRGELLESDTLSRENSAIIDPRGAAEVEQAVPIDNRQLHRTPSTDVLGSLVATSAASETCVICFEVPTHPAYVELWLCSSYEKPSASCVPLVTYSLFKIR